MRVSFLVPVADMSGGARVIHIYARYLRQQGHQVTLVVRPHKPMGMRDTLRAVKHGRWDAFRKKTATHYRAEDYDVRTLDRYRPIEARDVPDGDVVIATWWETAEWMLDLPDTKGKKVHFVQHYEAFDNQPAARVDKVLAEPTFKITISRWLDELLVQRFLNRDVVLIANGVDRKQFFAPRRRRQPRPTVGMLYSNAAFKDNPTGFAAFELLRKNSLMHSW